MYSRNLPKLWKKKSYKPNKVKVTNLYSNVTLDQRLLLKAFSVIYPNDILYTKLSTKKATSYIVKYYQTKGLSYQEWAYFWILFFGKNRIYPFRIFLNKTLSDGSYQSLLLFGVNLLTGLSTRGTIAIFLKIHSQSHTYFEKMWWNLDGWLIFFRFRAKEITSNHC